MKMNKLVFFVLISMLSLSACKMSGIEETTESLAGRVERVVLDGSQRIDCIGVPFRAEEIDEEILKQEDFLLELFPGVDRYVFKQGYYHLRTDTNLIDFNFVLLPVIQDGYITGSMTLHRRDDGSIETGFSSGEEKDGNLNRLLRTVDQVAFLYSINSEYVITDDNVVHTIYGAEPDEIVHADELFHAYSTQYNTISTKDLFERDNLLKITKD